MVTGIQKLLISFLAFSLMICIILMVHSYSLNMKIESLVSKQSNIINLQNKALKLDSLNSLKEKKFRENLNNKINDLYEQLDHLEAQNDYLIGKNRVRIQQYNDNKYKPLKYW